jgi:hypothetical protein
LPRDEIPFLGFALNLGFSDFDAYVAGPQAKFFGVFNEACFNGNFLHPRVQLLSLFKWRGFCGDAEFGLGLVGEVLVFKRKRVVATGLELAD